MPVDCDIATCGDAKIKILTDHFGVPKMHGDVTHNRVVDPVLVSAQWSTFKQALLRMKTRGLSLEDGYRKILSSEALPDVKVLACIFIIICLATVWCERGFSLMALIKTKVGGRSL